MSTYTEITETYAKPSVEEAAALRVIAVASKFGHIWRIMDDIPRSRANEIFAELVKAVKGEG